MVLSNLSRLKGCHAVSREAKLTRRQLLQSGAAFCTVPSVYAVSKSDVSVTLSADSSRNLSRLKEIRIV